MKRCRACGFLLAAWIFLGAGCESSRESVRERFEPVYVVPSSMSDANDISGRLLQTKSSHAEVPATGSAVNVNAEWNCTTNGGQILKATDPGFAECMQSKK